MRLERQRSEPDPDPLAEPEPLIEPDPEPLPDPAPLSEPLPLAAPLPEQDAKANDSAIAAIPSRAFLFMIYLLAWIRWAPSKSNTLQFGLSRVRGGSVGQHRKVWFRISTQPKLQYICASRRTTYAGD